MIEVKEQISGVRRTIGTRVLEAGEARVMTISQVYDTGQDDLWDVVTNPDRLPRWFLPVSGDLRVGGRYQFQGNAGGTITKCEKPHAVGATWEFGDQVSWVEVRLTPEGDGRTRFELEHVAHVDDEHWEQYGPGAVGLGWEGAFWGLANHLDDPAATITPEAAMEWAMSPDGITFMRLSADAWTEADIAFGTDPETARRQAANTLKAYTGQE
ncbi:SRPBCC family protein [Actinoplanes philippinensis]|uniref:SRPBCC family protein n=1 Tax=Actinoplanes philippinensis TaxID=35752 RepID=UPI0033C0B850